jgi:hypothetical protein
MFYLPFILPSIVGLYPPLPASTLRRWAMPFAVGLLPSVVGLLPSVVGLHLSSLGSTLHRWAMPFAVGFYPPSLGYALRRWASSLHRWAPPFIVGLHFSSLGSTLRRWAMPFAVGLCPSPLGFCPPLLGSTFCRWALSLWHLVSQGGGSSLSPLFPEAGLVGEKSSVGWNERRNEENEPRHSSWFVFMMHYMGLPHPGSPLVFLRLPFLHRANLSRPHPSGKGGADAAGSEF